MQEHGVLIIHLQLVQIVQAGGGALGGLARAGDVPDRQAVLQVVPGNGVGFGIPGAGLGVVSAVEILTGLGRVGIPVKGGQAQRLTELLVGVVGPQRCPVVVGTVVEVFLFVLRQGGRTSMTRP